MEGDRPSPEEMERGCGGRAGSRDTFGKGSGAARKCLYVSMDGMEWVNLRHRIANAWRDRGILISHFNRLRIHSSLILATETCERYLLL
jgi:hypothetical protein